MDHKRIVSVLCVYRKSIDVISAHTRRAAKSIKRERQSVAMCAQLCRTTTTICSSYFFIWSLSFSLLCLYDESSQYGCHLVLFILVDIGDHRSILLHLLNNERPNFNASSSSRHSLFKEQILISSNKQNTSIGRLNLFFFL